MKSKFGFLVVLLLSIIAGELRAQCSNITETTTGVKCANSIFYYTVPSGSSFYSWYATGGSIVSGGSGGSSNYWAAIKWDQSPGSPKTLSVTIPSGCINTLTITNLPPPVTITGPTVGCAGNQSTFTVPGTGPTPTWSYSAVAGIVSSATASWDPIALNWKYVVVYTASASGVVQVSAARDFTTGCTSKGFIMVTVENGVGSITGPASSNGGITQSYSVTGSSPNWSVTPAGVGSLVDPQGSNPMRIAWNCNVTSGTVVVNYTSPMGCPKSKSLAVTITPIVPTITSADGHPTSTYCYKAPRTLVTEPGYGTYTWTITGQNEPNFPITNLQIVKPSTDPNRNRLDLPITYSGQVVHLYGTVNIKVSYVVSSTCTSSVTSINMVVTPANIAFRTSNSAIPTVCYSDSQNIGTYTTETGYTNYLWSAVATTNIGTGTPTTGTLSSTNMNWTPLGSAIGGNVPLSVTYLNSTQNCTNTNLARNGVTLRAPSITGPSPVFIGQIGLFSSQTDGYDFAWAVTPTTTPTSRFTNASGTTIPPPTTSSTYIVFDTNDADITHPVVTTNYWIYYPQVGGTRISNCTGASKVVDVRTCNGCGSRIRTDIAGDPEELADQSVVRAVQAYPMPASHELWINNVPLGASIQLVSMTGVEAINTVQDQENLAKRIDTGGLSNGLYVIRTIGMDNQPVSMKVTVVH